jgi:hypothetical protein
LWVGGFRESDILSRPSHGTGTTGTAGTTSYWPKDFDVNIHYFTTTVPHPGLHLESRECY